MQLVLYEVLNILHKPIQCQLFNKPNNSRTVIYIPNTFQVQDLVVSVQKESVRPNLKVERLYDSSKKTKAVTGSRSIARLFAKLHSDPTYVQSLATLRLIYQGRR
ncbi:hypothetical protein RF11_09963 [Thelohanellus kitauei]|uniref:Uncharacterized protein n=1 Tax=Thelohanellus kitauei TaxID=669202 RepID=A0A0C2IAS6_THEKT|nr:hypothetical protein RF11_09963 [Thelohanellus kitauei]